MKYLNTFARGGFIVAFLMLLCNFAMAQRTVKGKVSDAESGEGLIGATITVVGTTRGATTDIDGNFSVEVPAGSTQLRFAYTGYAEQVLELSASNVVSVALKPGSVLDEVVVIGYGSVKRKDATGAVSSVTEKDFNRGAIAPEQLLQGRAAGVQVTNNSGEPGGGINIRIRGTSSVRGGNNPLFVVDGVPLSGDESSAGVDEISVGRTAARNPLNFLNPNDIASIDILKDASATAIYGSRGANGVVLITTKSGADGKGTIDYGYTLGFGKISKKYDLLTREPFLAAYTSFNGAAAAKTLDGGGDTDWQDEVTQTAVSHSHSLSFGNGGRAGDFRFSMGYLDQEGIIKESGIKRLSGTFSGSKKFMNDRLRVATMFTVSNTHDDGAPITENSGYEGDMWANALKANPTQKVRVADANGKLVLVQPGTSEPNPVAMIELTKDFTNTLRGLGNISAEYQIVSGLSFKTVLGFDRSFSGRKTAWSRDLKAGNGLFGVGRAYTSDIESTNKLWQNYFTYTKAMGKVNFTGLLGYEYQRFNRAAKRAEYANFRTGDLDLMIDNLASAGVKNDAGNLLPSVVPTNSSNVTDELQSYFGRVNFGILDKYIVTATLRADGSTRFGGNNKYGYFPSFAFKWRLIEESFVPKFFSDLGLRIGYGVTGNQEFGHNLYSDRSRYGNWDINGDPSVQGGGFGNVAFSNPDLKWESTSQANIGIDFGFWNSRIFGSLEFYKKNTKDLLIQVVAAQPAVSPFIWKNLDADVQNSGVELSLGVVAVSKAKFEWRVNVNGAYNKNIVKNYGGLLNTGEINGQGLTGAFAERIAEGQPLFAFFVRDFDGFDKDGITKYAGGDFQQFLGYSPIPKLTGGLTNSFTFGDIDFSFFFNGNFGHYVYNNTANAFFTAGALSNGRNVTTDVVGNGEGSLNAPDVSSRFLEKANFIRLQDLTLGYNFRPKNGTISNLRVFLNGSNLALFTKYSGQDPEVNINKSIDGVPSLGIDYTAYPRARTISLGASVSFK